MTTDGKKAQVLLGGIGNVSVPQLVSVGCGVAEVVVEPGALRKLKDDKETVEKLGGINLAIDGGVNGSGTGTVVPAPVARIAVVLKMIELLKGANKVRAPLVKFLEIYLNSGSSAPSLSLAGGAGGFAGLAGTLDGACALSPVEKDTLLRESTLTNAYAVICVEAAKSLLSLSTAVASLSSEALPADLRFLDPAALENYGNKHVVTAGMAMKGLLEGSSVLTSSKGKRLPSFSEAPFAQAIATHVVTELSKAVNVEVSCPQSVFIAGKDALAVKSSPVASLLLPFIDSVLKVAALSIDRIADLRAAITAASSEPTGALAELSALVGKHHEALKEKSANASKVSRSFTDSAFGGGASMAQSSAGVAAAAAVDVYQEALLIEAFSAVCLLRIKQGVKTAEAAAPEASGEAPGKDKKKKKKKEKKKKGGIGKGSEIVQKYFEEACMKGQGDSPYMNALVPSESADQGEPLDLGACLASLAGSIDWALGDVKKFLVSLQQVIEANQPRRKPKIAKGARDMLPDQMKIREGVFAKVVSVFKKHGAVSIDTPVFELRETLMGKYGEDTKLIYDLADQGGEILSLRYDLTVPFSRFCALHGTGNIKRYHVGKVYRRDQPQMNRGRFREFFQCDFDIAGTYSTMVPDSEVIKVMVEILSDLDIGDFCIKINHRLLLDSIMAVCGVPEQKFRPICSAIDKLDKSPWEEVRREMVEDKGLPPAAADKIGKIVELKGKPKEMLEILKSDPMDILADLRVHPKAKAALEELTLLFDFLEAMNALDRLSLDMSLARGLDYYTGVIYEAVLVGGNVGSIAAGGRYDYLVGSFAGKDIPAVGVSIGIERVYAIIEAKLKEEAERTGVPIRSTDTQVLVSSIGNGMQKKRMEVANLLWAAGISAEFGFKPNPKMGDQINYALESGIPFMVLFGDEEIKENSVKIKDMKERTEITVSLNDLIQELRKLF